MGAGVTNNKSSLWIFYLMFAYILISFLWWTSLFLKSNSQEFKNDVAEYRQHYLSSGGDPGEFEQTEIYRAFVAELKRRNAMIAGEGLVFISLIGVGFWKIRRSFTEEIELTRQQNNFILSITHELKSPLASIKLALETQLRHKPLEEVRRERLNAISLEEVERLESLVENILLASRLESKDELFDHQPLDFTALLEQIGRQFDVRHVSTHSLRIDSTGKCMVNGDRSALRAMINNLLENAVKYSPSGTKITATLQLKDGWVILRITDEGCGIPAAEATHIFKRFYRIGNEETRSSKGTGLGLYIVDSIVREHGGDIVVSPNNPVGSVFEIKLPAL